MAPRKQWETYFTVPDIIDFIPSRRTGQGGGTGFISHINDRDVDAKQQKTTIYVAEVSDALYS